MYGLPKVHKKDTPLRPVLSAINTFNYGLGKELTNILSELPQNSHTVKDTFEFVRTFKTNELLSTGNIMVSFDLLDEEFEKIREIAGHNGYPNWYVDKIVWEKLNQYYTPKVREPTVLRGRVVSKVPFYGQASLVYGRRVSAAVRNNFPLKEVKIVYVPEKLGKCFNTKDRVPTPLESGIVYKVTCPVCNEFYIGKTYRQFCKRTEEHLSDQAKLIGIFEPTLITPSLKAVKHNILTLSGKVSKMKKSSGNTSCFTQRITESRCVTRSQTGCSPRFRTTSTLELSLIEETVEQLCCKSNNKRKCNSVYVAKSAIGKHYSNTGHVIT
ncbi:unnamed protein product, partial [Didymodactylos carnosus]